MRAWTRRIWRPMRCLGLHFKEGDFFGLLKNCLYYCLEFLFSSYYDYDLVGSPYSNYYCGPRKYRYSNPL